MTRNPFAWVDGRDNGPFVDHLGLPLPEAGRGSLRQLIGDQGAGKTTHLRFWLDQVGGQYHYIDRDSTAVPPIGPLVYWDEADRLSDRQLIALFRRAKECRSTIVAGTHRDLSRPAKRAGLPNTTVVFGAVDLPLLRSWVDSRLEAALIDRRQPSTVRVSDEELRDLLESRPGVSLRFVGDDLHRIVARQVLNR